MYPRQQSATQFWTRAPAREHFIEGNQLIQNRSFPRWQLFHFGTQAPLQVLDDHWYQGDVGDPVTDKGVADELRTQRPQMNHTGAAYKRANESDHEIDGMVRGQN